MIYSALTFVKKNSSVHHGRPKAVQAYSKITKVSLCCSNMDKAAGQPGNGESLSELTLISADSGGKAEAVDMKSLTRGCTDSINQGKPKIHPCNWQFTSFRSWRVAPTTHCIVIPQSGLFPLGAHRRDWVSLGPTPWSDWHTEDTTLTYIVGKTQTWEEPK